MYFRSKLNIETHLCDEKHENKINVSKLKNKQYFVNASDVA